MRFLFVLLLFASFTCLHAQRFGGNPAPQKWKQINTDTVRVIFSAAQEKQAQTIAAIVHGLQQKNG